MLSLDAYLERIGLTTDPRPDLETLGALHHAHAASIPFENLSTLIGEPIPLDVESLEDKLVTRRRGGYCFEQNGLFLAALAAVGFEPTALAARVVWGQERGWVNPRTHMVLLVPVGKTRYLCDVGFGGVTLTAPLTLEPDREQTTPHDRFRLVERGGEYELQVSLEGGWRAMYQFDLQPQRPIDYEPLNHFVATHPSSHFRTHLMAARPHAGGRYALGDNELTSYAAGRRVDRRVLGSRAEIETVLVETFGITLPEAPALERALERIAAEASSRRGGTP